jgi:hypothetical protein
MACFRLAGLEFCFAPPVPGLEPYTLIAMEPAAESSLPVSFTPVSSCRTQGWVGEQWRSVESRFAPSGVLIKVAGGSDFYISSGGREIACLTRNESERQSSQSEITGLDREILLGPALVLALALRGTWCLHASAGVFKGHAIAFMGESGLGKSTLAAYLAAEGRPHWELVADDILPVTLVPEGVEAKPHFPQLKLPAGSQPGFHLPEDLPLDRICCLTPVDPNDQPGLEQLPPNQAAQMLVSHTAAARLFDPALLSEHLAFCAQVAAQLPLYRLTYPHREGALPVVKELLETLW